MTGRAEAAAGRAGRLAGLARRYRRYVAVDGGRGAHLLAELAGLSPRLQPVPSPRHADLLIVVEPVCRKLAPAVVEVARALPHPAHALILGDPEGEERRVEDIALVEEILPGARRIAATSAPQLLAAALDGTDWPELAIAAGPRPEETNMPVPGGKQMEVATEPAVLSLGPIQPFTAGPLRLLLVADGGQLLSARVEAGYAHRGIAEAMVRSGWRQAAHLARRLDPLAPLAGQAAYARALESLQGRPSLEEVERSRDAALALERAESHLWWLAHLADLLESDRLAGAARHLAAGLSGISETLWELPPVEWIVPQGGCAGFRAPAIAELRRLTREVVGLRNRVRGDRLLALRTRGIGTITSERFRAAGVTGPVLRAAERGEGDTASRVAARLDEAVAGLREAAETAGRAQMVVESPPLWTAPAGMVRVAVEGPRGRITLGLVSEGGDGPAAVSWDRPSAALLALLPELLAGQKLADAGAIVASLDLSMAEADG